MVSDNLGKLVEIGNSSMNAVLMKNEFGDAPLEKWNEG